MQFWMIFSDCEPLQRTGCPGTGGSSPALPLLPWEVTGWGRLGKRLGKARQEKRPCSRHLFKGPFIPEPGDLSPTVFKINVSALTSQLYPPVWHQTGAWCLFSLRLSPQGTGLGTRGPHVFPDKRGFRLFAELQLSSKQMRGRFAVARWVSSPPLILHTAERPNRPGTPSTSPRAPFRHQSHLHAPGKVRAARTLRCSRLAPEAGHRQRPVGI